MNVKFASKLAARHLAGTMVVAGLAMIVSAAHGRQPLGTAFTYQGELASAGAPATGTYDIRFRLYDAPNDGNQIGTTLCSDNLAVSAGRFGASLDFGGVFTGQRRFLEIEVRQDAGLDCSDASGYTVLSPRQELTATPNATYSLTATNATSAASLNGQPASFFTDAANLTGTVPDASLSPQVARLNADQTFTGRMTFSNPASAFTGAFSGSGAGLTALSGGSIVPSTILRGAMSQDLRLSLGTPSTDWTRTPYLNPTNVATGGGSGGVAILGNNAYVINALANTLQVFSLTDPARPALIGTVATAPSPRAIAAAGSFVYVVNQQGANTLQAFDVSNPAAPVAVRSLGTSDGPVSIAIAGNTLVVACFGGHDLLVFDITNPAAMERVGRLTVNAYAQSVAASGTTAYLVTQGDPPFLSDGNRLFAISIANPATPTVIGSVQAASGPASVDVAGSFAYVASLSTTAPLQIFNIGGAGNPVLAGSFTSNQRAARVRVALPYAFVANLATNAVDVYNVSTPAAIARIGSFAAAEASSDLAVTGSYVYATQYTAARMQVISGGLAGVAFSAPLVANLSGNATSATSAQLATVATTANNALLLGGQPGSFYTNASNINTGTLAAGQIPNLDASKITTGTLGVAQIPNLDASKLTTGTLADGLLSSNIPRLNVNNTFTGDTQTFTGRIRMTNGVITDGTNTVGTTDLGLYSQRNGFWQRYVTSGGGGYSWYTDGLTAPAGGAARMQLTSAGLSVVGSLSKGGGSFKIDHPLDPENKYLYHSFVESPDMMNIYNGITTTDIRGFAVVELPDYFEALNRDFRYQLTVVDDSENDFILAKVYREIGVDAPRQFTVKSSMPNIKISWQVTGIRQDAWAQKNRIPNSIDKPATEKGTLLHPEAFVKVAGQGIVTAPAADAASRK